MSDAWLVVGLGNPGPEYARTRHNVGWFVLDALLARTGGQWRKHPSRRADVVEGRLGGVPGHRVVLGRPRAYMNESGGPVSTLTGFYGVPPERLVVIHDELDLDVGQLRVKLGGGDNGHNGLRSIRRSLSTGDYFRVRVGVGRPPGRQDPADYVLKPFGKADADLVAVEVERAADAVESIITDGLERTQSAYNS